MGGGCGSCHGTSVAGGNRDRDGLKAGRLGVQFHIGKRKWTPAMFS